MRVSSPATVSISVVSGPTSQRAPIRVAPRRNVPGSTIVSRPISTPTSISVLAGSTIVTPASAWRAVDPLAGRAAAPARARRAC